jgi:arsenic resistance protein ArsH
VRDRSDYLTSRYSERKEAFPEMAAALAAAAMSHEAGQDETKDELE